MREGERKRGRRIGTKGRVVEGKGEVGGGEAKERLCRREGRERRKKRRRKGYRRLLCSAQLKAAGRKQVSPTTVVKKQKQEGSQTLNHRLPVLHWDIITYVVFTLLLRCGEGEASGCIHIHKHRKVCVLLTNALDVSCVNRLNTCLQPLAIKADCWWLSLYATQ